MAPSSPSTTTSVQVALRIRPSTAQDAISIPARFQRTVIHAISPTSVSVEATPNATAAGGATPPASATSSGSSAKKQAFTFDQVHPPSATQHSLFVSTAQPLISRFLEGFNCTILAYGQTSSGKTFTMTGIDLDADPSDPNNGMGIVPRAVSMIFSRAKQLKEERGGGWTFGVKGSFIEIYNEDLIDLLSLDDAMGGRREVQIREDKDGHIIWGGLREVNVKSANEVMILIRKGTSIRRTNETDMNAQSSRSHAIFSLTLTQKKYVGSGTPPRSGSPVPPTGRSPSRLARPGSMYSNGSVTGTRASSPTLGRPATPSFAAAMGRGGLRPSSALGHVGERLKASDEDAGEWVTIVSKFHFVDLAGSERLKRTAAVGERIKEGISINSGLLALGNVISALGDPSRAKSHTNSHVPYRDSKLTRLLQDSLGGNAHTLMIACVSPAEWNAAETVNTLKYANRARNIKNRAVVNEKEDGWDDVEWLQGTVTRLRKELKALKEGVAIDNRGNADTQVLEGAGKKVLAQMTELQNNYEDLREKYVERTEELTRLRRELGEQHRVLAAGAVGGTAKYEEIVGPVIEEYEKTIATMEAELSLNRAALRHTNEMVEEKEDDLAAITERHAATELYVEELRARVAKLSEREASTEAYVRDLEERLKAYDETSISSSDTMSDLKKEISRFKDSETQSAEYIADLEARLAKSDESIMDLQQTIENLEKESDRRRDEVEVLQSRLESLRRDGESWRADLEERERRVKELEERMEEWERRREEAGETRARLGFVVGEVEQARKSLELGLANRPQPLVNGSDPSTVYTNGRTSTTPEEPATPTSHQSPEIQLLALQQTHTATLADLSSVTAKYRDALQEISDLATQIEEAKLGNSTLTDSPIIDRLDASPHRRKLTGGRGREMNEPQSQLTATGRRLFFRQAASTESLHSRSLSQSLSLSQELSSARSRKTSFSSHGTSGSHSPSNSHSTTSLMSSRPNLSISLPNATERSVSSLESEIMRLQEVLKEREAEILILETSLKETKSKQDRNTPTSDDNTSTLSPKPNGVDSITSYLTPKTLGQFEHIRRSMELTGREHLDLESEKSGSVSEMDESLDRLNELMLSMAQKEAQHGETVDNLNDQLSQVRRQLDDLTTLSRDQAINMSTEMEALRSKHADDLTTLERVQEHEAELLAALSEAESTHTQAMEELRTAHEIALKAKGVEVDELIARIQKEHESSLEALRAELAAKTNALAQSHQDHSASFGKLKAEHEAEMQRRLQEANDILEDARKAHEAVLTKLAREHAEILKQKEAEATNQLQTTEEEYYNALTKLRGDHAKALEKQASEAAAAMERLREEHAGQLRIAELAREGSLAESESSLALALEHLQNEHASAITRKEASFAEDITQLKTEYERSIARRDGDHILQLDRLRAEHEGTLMRVKEEWRVESERLKSALSDSQEETTTLSAAAAKARSEMETTIQLLQQQQSSVLEEKDQEHATAIAKLKQAHETLEVAKLEAHAQYTALLQAHSVELTRLKGEHEKALADVHADLIATRELQREMLEQVRLQGERLLAEEKERLQATLSDLERQHAEERDILRKDHDLLIQELEAHKVAADEYAMVREQTRQIHEQVLAEKSITVETLQTNLSAVTAERDRFEAEIAKLRGELERTQTDQSRLLREASEQQSLADELVKHRSELAETQELLQRTREERDTLQSEKLRQDNLVKELQAQVARSSSPPNVRPVAGGYSRGTTLPAMKLPPPTPPPSVPPPPAPRATHLNGDHGATSSPLVPPAVMSSPSKDSQPESPVHANGHPALDPKAAMRLEHQSKQIEEQEAMIKTLNKQLTHCESDLQTHMDLVTTLETSLGDSEKNLRKARMHATELARERDTLNAKIETLRNELQEAKREVATVRMSIAEEKQSLEQRLDEERKAKERARAQLDMRMEELQKRKSKFACL